MFSLDALRAVRTVVSHHACSDGVASAVLVKAALPDVTVRFLAHETQEHRELAAEPGILFVDFCPPRERAREFVDAGAIVLDHHVTQRDDVEMFGERGVYSDEPGVSGAVLAYQHVFEPVRLSDGAFNRFVESDVARAFARVVGIRDTWQRHEGEVRRMTLSTRSHTTFDCAAFCTAMCDGGGGHRRAAGGTLELESDDVQPFTMIAELVEAYEDTCRAQGEEARA